MIPHHLSGLDWARLALRMNQFCLGSYRGSCLPFIPFVAHLSCAMGARLTAPHLNSPLELWRVVADDRRYIAPRSRFSDFRALPCHLRALASTISEFVVQTSYASWAKNASIRDTCLTLAEATMTDSYDFGLPFVLGNKFSRHARAMIITSDQLSKNEKCRTLSPEAPSHRNRRDQGVSYPME